MNDTTQLKILSLVAGILATGTAFLYWQQGVLANQLAENNLLCDERIVAFLDARQNNSRREIAVTNTGANKPVEKIATAQMTTADIIKDNSVDAKPTLQRYNESIEDVVKRKYRFLFSRLNLSAAEMDELIHLLIDRERIALLIRDAEDYSDEVDLDNTDIADYKYELEDIDSRIEQILGNDETYQRFSLLKDSDTEQEEFGHYTLGITGLFPLDRGQQEEVLFARLRHKQKFEEEISSTGFDMDYPLTNNQQQEIISKIERAIDRYKKTFLDDARENLEHDNFPMDQYTLLENYTNTEFKDLLSQYREKIESRGVIPD